MSFLIPFFLLSTLEAVTRFLPPAGACEASQVSFVRLSFGRSSWLSYDTSGVGLVFLLCVCYFTVTGIWYKPKTLILKHPHETSFSDMVINSGSLYPILPSLEVFLSCLPSDSFHLVKNVSNFNRLQCGNFSLIC